MDKLLILLSQVSGESLMALPKLGIDTDGFHASGVSSKSCHFLPARQADKFKGPFSNCQTPFRRRSKSGSERQTTHGFTFFVLLVLGLLYVAGSDLFAADRIVLKNGNVIQVDSVWEDSDGFHYVRNGGEYTLSRGMVLKVEKSAPTPPSPSRDLPVEVKSVPSEQSSATPKSDDKVQRLSVEEWVESILPEAGSTGSPDDNVEARWKELQQRVRQDPNDAALHNDWLVAVSGAVSDRIAKKDLSGAADILNRSLDNSPQDFTLLLHAGAVSLRLGRFKAAQKSLRAAVALSPQSLEANELLGLAEYFLDNNSRAIACWETALTVSPGAAVAGLLSKVKREEEVEKDFKFRHSSHFEMSSEGAVLQSGLARAILDELEADYAAYVSLFGVNPPEQLHVLLYPNQEFKQATNSPDFVTALNDGKIRIPVKGVTGPNPALSTLLKHELAHTFIQLKSQGRAPRWLHEGLAQFYSIPGVCEKQNTWWMSMISAGPPALSSLESSMDSAGSEQSASQAYLTSLSVVCYLNETYGNDSLQQFLSSLATANDFNDALQQVFHDNTTRIEVDWRNYVERIGRTSY